MANDTTSPDLSGRHILIPGGTGGVGQGAVRAYLAAGADVVVPTRNEARAEEFRTVHRLQPWAGQPFRYRSRAPKPLRLPPVP